MSDTTLDIDRLEESTINRYKADCARFEQKQDSIKRQRRLLETIDEQMRADAEQTYRQLEDYSDTEDIYLYQLMISSQNQVSLNQAKAQRYFEQAKEDLAQEDRKLARAFEKRKQQFKKDLQTLHDD